MQGIERFIIDTKASSFTAKAFASGMSSGFGHSPTIAIREFAGEIDFEPDSLGNAMLSLRIRAESLQSEDEMSAGERQILQKIMYQDVLAASRHPEITYKSTEVTATKLGEGLFRVGLTGKLGLRGISRNQTVPCQVTVGPYSLRATGNFEIRQSDFNIPIVNIAGGTLTLRDEIKFAFFIVARQKEPGN